MTLHQLKVWTAVAKRLSITKAADGLHIRQPSVTQQIKLLEKEYPLKLYEINFGRGRCAKENAEALRWLIVEAHCKTSLLIL